MDDMIIIPNGIETENGELLKEVPLAVTTGEAEQIYTKKPSEGKLYSWFAEVIAVSIRNIGDDVISDTFLKNKGKTRIIPKKVKDIDFIDAGTLILQIHRDCWEDVLPEQKLKCFTCSSIFTESVDLKKVDIPKVEGDKIKFIKVRLEKDYFVPKLETFGDMIGARYNSLTFRVATLGDAIRHEGVAKNEVLFWRKLCFDTLTEISYVDEDGEENILADRFRMGRGMLLFNNDLSTKELKHIRRVVQKATPSANLFYEDVCPECGATTPYICNVNAFFLT